MRTYVSTLGFHETRVTRPVLRHGLDDEDVVVLLRPDVEAGDRGEDAVGYVKDMLQEVAPGVSVVTEQIDTSELTGAVLACSDVIGAAEGELVLNFGGGAREVFLPFVVAAVLHAPEIDTAFQYTDVDQSVQSFAVPNLTAQVPENARDTLEHIVDEGEVSISALADMSDRSKSTVSRHVNALVDSGIVRTQMDGQVKRVISTPTAEFLRRTPAER